MAVIAFVLIALTITIETSIEKNTKFYTNNNIINNSNNNNNNNYEYEPTTSVTYSLDADSLANTQKPDKEYGQNNLNHLFLRQYYSNNYPSKVKLSNKFYISN